ACADPINDRRNTSRVRSSLARVELRTGAVDAALHQAQQALDLARLLDHALFESDALVSLGLAQIAAGSLEQADAALAHALVFQESIGHPTMCLEAYAGRAAIALARRDHAAACRSIQPILKALAEHPLLPGRIDRGYVLWTAYQVLLASNPGQAIAFLHTANQLLATLATRIGADHVALAVWRAIPEHVRLAAAPVN
ncbi:MAG TPA: hypothetical protein VFT99_21660, partial [Roseiflexaceae bacterium]|nr:hypothetical protein [Roseiflexaceae bacterium]